MATASPQRQILFQTLLAQLQPQLEILPDKSEESAELTLRALWLCAQGQPQSAARAEQAALRDLNQAESQQLQLLLAQRISGVPLAHISERQNFMGLELRATPAALIPRRETEILAQLALRCLLESNTAPAPLVLDVCTGSGNIALAVASQCRQARVYGSDLSPQAVALAVENSE